jgi:hypothetical protein
MRAKRLRPAPTPRRRASDDPERHDASGTAVAAEALRTGLPPLALRRRVVIPREDETIRVGDPDDDSLANEYVGDETPGGSTPTPDQANVDEIGRAYGLQEDDTGALRTSAEVLARRDRRRIELQPPGKPRP